MAENRGIGLRGGLPWHLPEDLKRFKALTMGHAIIMGRATHESIGRALPGRRNIVVTRNPGATFAGCDVANSLEAGVALARSSDPMPMIIGGAQLYAEALPRVTRLFLTEVAGAVAADTFFPEISRDEWREVSRLVGESGLRYVELERIRMGRGDT
jgi:dihydrofolate reductase